MRILIVNSRLEFSNTISHMRPGSLPSNVAVVAAALAPHCSDIQIFDFLASDDARIDENGIAYGKSDEEYAAFLTKNQFDAVGISSLWTIHHKTALATARLIRKISPNAIIFAGGHHITVSKALDNFDFIVTGEIENIAVAVTANIAAHKNGDKSIRIVEGSPVADFDRIPMPAYEKLDLPFYRAADRMHQGSILRGGVPLTTSRGCPYHCNFCAVHLSMGYKWRPASPASVLMHLSHLKRLGFSKFYFEDDNFTMDKKRWVSIMEGMLGQDYQWTAPNGLRLDTLDKSSLALAAASGCREIKVSIESSVEEIRNKVISKNLDLKNIETVAAQCRELNIGMGAFFMIGIPGETLDNMRETLFFAKRMRDEFGIRPICSTATPFPGTDLYNECIDKGFLAREYTPEALIESLSGKGFIQTDAFTPQQVTSLREEILG